MRHDHLSLRSQQGMTLLSTLMAVGIGTLLVMGVTTALGNVMRANSSLKGRADLGEIRQTVAARLDCDQTLGAAAPVACDGAPIALKDATGRLLASNGVIGAWTVEASCPASCDADGNDPGTGSAACNQVVVTARQKGLDPLTGRARNLTPSSTRGATVSVDLFGGTSNFCGKKFVPPPPPVRCPAGSLYCSSSKGSWALVAGAVVQRGGGGCGGNPQASHYGGSATCPAGYMATGGGGQCQLPPYGGEMLTSTITRGANGWSIDCCSFLPSFNAGKGTTRRVNPGYMYVLCTKI